MKSFDMEIRSTNMDEREVEGLAVPWNETIDVSGYRERFERGAIQDVSNTKLFWSHDQIIGHVTEGRETDEGFWIKAKVAETTLGNDALALLRAGSISRMSVGFIPVEETRDQDVTVRTKVNLKEVSLVPFPAYEGSVVTAVRESNKKEERNMSDNDNIAPEVRELQESVNLLERKVDSIETPSIVVPKSRYNSYGEYIKGYVNREDDAVALYREYTGGTSADAIVKDAWVGSVVDIVNKPRKVLNAFSTAVLPSTGLKVEYAKIDGDTVAVANQATEGATLQYGAISLTTETADVHTYGGYVQMSRQEIERSNNVSVLETAFEAMAARYGSVTNAVVRTAVAGATTQEVSFDAADLDDTAEVLGLVYDAAEALDTYAASLDAVVVSGSVFKALATITDGANRPVLDYGQGSNTIGSASVAGINASIAGVPVIVDPVQGDVMWFVNKSAVKTFESPGAPLRLSDGDITNLTNVYSVYGYLAVAVQRPHLVVKVDFGAGS